MGFGSLLGDGTVLLNEEAVRMFNLTHEEIDRAIEEVLQEIKRREKRYRGNKPFPIVKNKIVILVDDGVATGYTMFAAIKFIKTFRPKKIIVASPVCSYSVSDKIKPLVDELKCFYAQTRALSFAVASYYEEFPDLTDEEVVKYLAKAAKIKYF